MTDTTKPPSVPNAGPPHRSGLATGALIRLAWRLAKGNRVRTTGLILSTGLVVGFGPIIFTWLESSGWAIISPLVIVLFAVFTGMSLAVSVRRNVRTYGQLRAVGATGSQIRRLVLLEVLTPTLVGVVLGIVGAVLFFRLPIFSSLVPIYYPEISDGRIDDFPPAARRLSSIFPIAAAVAGVSLAALRPGRQAARVDVAEARRERLTDSGPETADSSRGVPLPIWFGGGVLLLLILLTGTPQILTVILGFGLVAIPLGWALPHIGNRADKAPTNLRFAARDLGRNQTRSHWAIVGSLALTTLGIMGISGIQSDAHIDRPMDQRFILVLDDPSAWPYEQTLDRLRETVDVEHEVELSRAAIPILLVPSDDSVDSWPEQTNPFILTSELADALNIPAAMQSQVERGAVLVDRRTLSAVRSASIDVVVGYDVARGEVGDGVAVETVVAEIGGYSNGPKMPVAYISRRQAEEWWNARPADYEVYLDLYRELVAPETAIVDGEIVLFVASEPVTSNQQEFIKQSEDGVDMRLVGFSSTGMPGNLSTNQVIWIVLAIVVSIGLILARIFAGLVGREIDNELSTMVSLGAKPSVRRRMLATQTFIQSLIGGVAGVVLGSVLFYLVTASDRSVVHPIFVWPALAILALGVPVLAAGLVYLTTRSAHPSVSRATASRSGL